MHIILGILGTLVTLLILANRLKENGIDIGWLNPFSWARRRKFRKEYQMHPAYTLESPIDVAALFVVAVAKADGDITKAQKEEVMNIFTNELNLNEREAQDLFGSSVHIFGRGDDVFDNPSRVLARTIEQFNEAQIASVIEMMERMAHIDGEPNEKQKQLIKKVTKALPIKSLH